MSLALVEAAIVARLASDSTLTGLLAAGASGITVQLGRTARAQPYIVVVVYDQEDTDAFDSDGCTVTAEIGIIADIAAGQVTPRAIIERIRGDATTHADRVPTYGLHRYAMTLDDANWKAGTCQRIEGSTQHDIDSYTYVETYRLNISRTAPAS